MLIIDNIPNIASSRRTVCVAWFGKKLKILEFWTFLISVPKISWIPLFVVPNTISIGSFVSVIFFASNTVKFFPFFDVRIILPFHVDKIESKLDTKKITNPDEPILVVFGTTNKGVYDILGSDIKKIQNANIFNFFPNQGTKTVRLEEAILGTLSIINILNHGYDKK